MSSVDKSQREQAIWPVSETRWGDRRAHVATHPDTGLRIVARERFALGTFRVFVAPPAENGDSELYCVEEMCDSQAEAKEAVLNEIVMCRDGAPRTFDGATGEWRCSR